MSKASKARQEREAAELVLSDEAVKILERMRDEPDAEHDLSALGVDEASQLMALLAAGYDPSTLQPKPR